MKKFLMFAFFLIYISGCKNNRSFQDASKFMQHEIKISWSEDLVLFDMKLEKILVEYISRIEKSKKKQSVLYQFFIGKNSGDTASIYLSICTNKANLRNKLPIGSFVFNSKKFFVFSGIADFCKKDTTFLLSSEYRMLPDRFVDDGRIWDYPTYCVKKIRDSVWIEGTFAPLDETQILKSTVKFQKPE